MKRVVTTLALLLTGCLDLTSSSSTSTVTLITGLVLPAEEIVVSRGCGTGETEVYKYAAFVSNGDTFRAAGLYDCFTDAYFVNLPASASSSAPYTVDVFAFSRTAYDAQAAAVGSSVASASPSGLAPTYQFACSALQQSDAQVIVRCSLAFDAGASGDF